MVKGYFWILNVKSDMSNISQPRGGLNWFCKIFTGRTS